MLQYYRLIWGKKFKKLILKARNIEFRPFKVSRHLFRLQSSALHLSNAEPEKMTSNACVWFLYPEVSDPDKVMVKIYTG